MSESLWSRYIEELRGGATKFVEYEWGFISYSLPPQSDVVFVEDVYIVPESRDAAHAYSLLGAVEQAGRKAGRTHSLFVVRTDSINCAHNLRIYLAMGYVPVSAESGSIWLKRQMSEGE